MAQYESVKIDKSLYNLAGKTFTQALEALDPSAAYKNTELADLDAFQDPSAAYKNTELADLDAFQRQLKRFDIKVSGAASDVVEKFFTTADSATLFPTRPSDSSGWICLPSPSNRSARTSPAPR